MENITAYKQNEVECPKRPKGVEGQYVYLLLCNDGSIYCGSTKNLKKRIKEHESSETAYWTKIRRPLKLVYFEEHENLLSARRREKQIKGWSVVKKLNLVNGVWGKQ